MLPSVHEDDQNHVLPWLFSVWRQSVDPLCDGVHLPSVVASSLIVELDDRELVRSPGHEAVKSLMLSIGHDAGEPWRLEGRKALETVNRR